jgi:uncharacterized protein (DUF736 family)
MSKIVLKTPVYGALFENEKKQQGSKQPDFTGTLGEDKKLYISAWYEEGNTSLMLKFSQKEDGKFAEKGTGNLITVEKRAENNPDVKGEISLDDTTYDIAGWNKVSKNGKPYISLKVAEPFKKSSSAPSPSPSASSSSSKAKETPVEKNRYDSKSGGDSELKDIFDFTE